MGFRIMSSVDRQNKVILFEEGLTCLVTRQASKKAFTSKTNIVIQLIKGSGK
jgi:hypothetical protein